jgi:hydroxymethylpyrimidine kinase / phosphomethylpyrimidine kinase / thiamine-phosphate diphosphorylase
MKTILTIAGYDPSSGAGISQDIETFSCLGAHGVSVPTCIVVQGPDGVRAVHPLPQQQFRQILEETARGLEIRGVKVGVMWDVAYIECTAAFLSPMKHVPVVIDPVMKAKNGKRLLSDQGLRLMVDKIFPAATLVTPNIDEASAITGKRIQSLDDMAASARQIQKAGPKAVLIKGGHLTGEPVDLLLYGKDTLTWKRPRIHREVHGTGCLFSSAILSFLVHGYAMEEAFLAAEGFVEEMMRESYRLDKDGYFYASPAHTAGGQGERWKALKTMREARKRLNELHAPGLIPEVQMNVGFALPGAKGTEDVAAFPGRIGRHHEGLLVKEEPEFGASSHVARLILTFMGHYPHMRSAANLRFSEAMVKRARTSGLRTASFDRQAEPEEIKAAEGKGLDYLVENVLKTVKSPPDIIYDRGGVGKEPMIRLFARDPLELIEKMEMIAL